MGTVGTDDVTSKSVRQGGKFSDESMLGVVVLVLSRGSCAENKYFPSNANDKLAKIYYYADIK